MGIVSVLTKYFSMSIGSQYKIILVNNYILEIPYRLSFNSENTVELPIFGT